MIDSYTLAFLKEFLRKKTSTKGITVHEYLRRGETPMTYMITRTSDFYGEKKPCAGAFLVGYKGKMPLWGIEIRSLEHLMALVKDEGPIIVGPNSLEIYDGYRE